MNLDVRFAKYYCPRDIGIGRCPPFKPSFSHYLASSRASSVAVVWLIRAPGSDRDTMMRIALLYVGSQGTLLRQVMIHHH